MTNTNTEVGISAEEMSVKDLRILAVSLNLFTEEEVASKKKKELLEAVKAKEIEMLENKEREGLKRMPSESIKPSADIDAPDTHEGKKVISRTEIELNGKRYMDILVESGETYRELMK